MWNAEVRLLHGSGGWENHLPAHPDLPRNRITPAKRVKMISPCRTWLVDLDVFGQRAFLHVRRPAVRAAHSCVRMTGYLGEGRRCLLFPDVLCAFLSTGHSGEGLRVWAGLRDGDGGAGGVCLGGGGVLLLVVSVRHLAFHLLSLSRSDFLRLGG